jgi:aspartyl-tRNA(Asn)/glutamyl-tRNA(Gln) amidotransferase subunit A
MARYDPRVAQRVLLAKDLSAADYIDLGILRTQFQREVEALLAPYDAFLLPTTPCIAPPIAEVNASDEDYFRWNMRILRIVGLVNFLDGCAVSLPCQPRAHLPIHAPVGLMVSGPAMSDRRILAVAAAVERALATD